MDRNSIIGIIVIAIIIFLWGILSRPSKEELEKRKRMVDSLKQVQQEQVDQTIIEQQEKEAEAEIAELKKLSVEELNKQIADLQENLFK